MQWLPQKKQFSGIKESSQKTLMSEQSSRCVIDRRAHLFEVERSSKVSGENLVSGVVKCPHYGQRKTGMPCHVYVTRKLVKVLESWTEKRARK